VRLLWRGVPRGQRGSPWEGIVGAHCQRRQNHHAREHSEVLRSLQLEQRNEASCRVDSVRVLPGTWHYTGVGGISGTGCAEVSSKSIRWRVPNMRVQRTRARGLSAAGWLVVVAGARR
jgi:hypothetical protein